MSPGRRGWLRHSRSTTKPFHLATNDEFSSFDFKSLSPSVFQATFKTTTAARRQPRPASSARFTATTATTAGFSATNPIVFYARLTDLPTGQNAVTEKNVVAIHTYDDKTRSKKDGIGDLERGAYVHGRLHVHVQRRQHPRSQAFAREKIQNNPKVIDVWVWDSSNGGIKFGAS